MTDNEAIKELKEAIDCCTSGEEEYFKESLGMGILAIEEIQQYRAYKEIFENHFSEEALELLSDKEEFGKWLERGKWIAKRCDEINRELEQYRAIGTVEQLKTMFDGFWKLKDLCEEYEKYGLPEDYWKLNEMCKKYSAIGTIEEFKALKEKGEPKKVQYDEYGKEEGYPYCECGKCLIDDFVGVSYCPDCGQKLDFGKEE